MLTKNFSSEELHCHCCHKEQMCERFMEKLQTLRDIMNRPIGINSGYRCESHNRSIGGHKTSQHMLGVAVDISTTDWSSSELYELMRHAYRLGFKGIGVGKLFVHLDMRVGKAKMWVY